MALTLRSYQEQIVEQVQHENAIIKMPTGFGKTFVASEIIKRHFSRRPGAKALSLVPTVDLVDQQAKAVETWFGSTTERVARYHGGLSAPQMAVHRVMVSTPSAFLALQTRDLKFSWEEFGICIFDEVHHVLKDHPYRKIASAQSFLDSQCGCGPDCGSICVANICCYRSPNQSCPRRSLLRPANHKVVFALPGRIDGRWIQATTRRPGSD